MCLAHGTGYMAAVESVEGAVQYKYTEFDLRYIIEVLYIQFH